MKHVWDTAIALCAVETNCLNLKNELANGSMLKGHTAKDLADVDQIKVIQNLNALKRNVALLESLVLA